MKVQLNFKGLMCPVFTAFNDDKKRTINYDNIEKYALLLKQKGVTAILVNSAIGEGTCLKVEERKRMAEEWLKVCRKNQLMCMVQIGGCCIADVYDLAQHAENIQVDACICLPDLMYGPRCEEDLVQYLKDVCQYCPTRPLLYCHLPILTKVNLSMPRLCDLAEKEIPNFNGVHYCHSDLDEAVACLKNNRIVILGWDSILLGGLVHQFECICMTMLNHYTEMVVDIYNNVRNNKLQDAMVAQHKLSQCMRDIYKRGGDFVHIMKDEFNKIARDIKVGPCRKPNLNLINRQC